MANKYLVKVILAIIGILIIAILLALSTVIKSISDKSITIKPEIIKATLKDGERLSKEITLSNELNKNLILESRVIGVKGRIIGSTGLNPKESKIIIIEAWGPDNEYGTFAGEAQFSSKEGSQSALIVIDTETAIIDYDATIEPVTSALAPGSKASFTITLHNLKGIGTESVYLEYSLISSMGNVLQAEAEKASVSTGGWRKISLSRQIRLPENAAPGKYVFAVKVSTEKSSSSASTVFDIEGIRDTGVSGLLPSCKDSQCSGLSLAILIMLMITALFVGGYSYYSLGFAIRQRIKPTAIAPRKTNLELAALAIIALIASAGFYQIAITTGIASKILGNMAATLKMAFILLLVFALLQAIRYKGNTILSLIGLQIPRITLPKVKMPHLPSIHLPKPAIEPKPARQKATAMPDIQPDAKEIRKLMDKTLAQLSKKKKH